MLPLLPDTSQGPGSPSGPPPLGSSPQGPSAPLGPMGGPPSTDPMAALLGMQSQPVGSDPGSIMMLIAGIEQDVQDLARALPGSEDLANTIMAALQQWKMMATVTMSPMAQAVPGASMTF